MADITIDDAVQSNNYGISNQRSLVWTDKDTGYLFFVDSGLEFHYRKTTDAGATWGTEVTIEAASTIKFVVWYDKWTKNDTGDVIHIAFLNLTENDIIYNSFSTSDDILDGAVTVFDGASATPVTTWAGGCISIVKSVGGNIYVGGWIDTDGENGFWKATQSPATSFASRTTVADGNEVDRIMFLPGNEADTNDIWCIYQDISADELTLKVYDDTANSWSESAKIDDIIDGSLIFQFDCVSRHSDDHSILVMWNEVRSATGDLAVWDFTDSSTFTAKTDVVSNSNIFEVCGLMIDQNTNDLYVGYNDAVTTGNIVYQKSTDGGGTWGGETAMSVTGDDHRLVIGGTSVGTDGGRWMPVWFNDDLNDLLTNADNSIEILKAVTTHTVSVSDTLSMTDTFTRGVWTLARTFTETISISDNIAILPTRTRKIIRDTLSFIKTDLLNNITDPESSNRPSNSKFVMSSYPNRPVHYPLVTVKVTNINVIRTGARSNVQEVLLNLEIRVWGRNEKEKDEIYTDILNRLNDIQLTSKGSIGNNLHDFAVLSSVEIDEEGEPGGKVIKSRILQCQYRFYNIL